MTSCRGRLRRSVRGGGASLSHPVSSANSFIHNSSSSVSFSCRLSFFAISATSGHSPVNSLIKYALELFLISGLLKIESTPRSICPTTVTASRFTALYFSITLSDRPALIAGFQNFRSKDLNIYSSIVI